MNRSRLAVRAAPAAAFVALATASAAAGQASGGSAEIGITPFVGAERAARVTRAP